MNQKDLFNRQLLLQHIQSALGESCGGTHDKKKKKKLMEEACTGEKDCKCPKCKGKKKRHYM